MKFKFTSSADGGTSNSHAISPALLCERLRVYLLGSVCPMRDARDGAASMAAGANAKVITNNRKFRMQSSPTIPVRPKNPGSR